MSGRLPAVAGGTGRLPELDVYRGLALVLMVLIHNMFTWTPLNLRQWPGPWQIGDLYFGMSASLFFAATGATAFVSLRRRTNSSPGRAGVLSHVGSRSLMLYAIGIAFEQVWHAPPYDVTFFAELNTIAVIGILALWFVLRDTKTGPLTIVAAGIVSSFLVIRYLLRLHSVAYGVYVVTPFWADAPSVQVIAAFPLAKLAVEFTYSFSIFGAFGVVGVILARLLIAGRIGLRLLGLGGGLMFAGYAFEFGVHDSLQKWPMSMSYFLLATGFTILMFFVARILTEVPGVVAKVLSSPLASVGRYALPLYLAHYLVIFFAETTGVAADIRAVSSSSTGVLVVGILGGVVFVLAAAAWIADRFHVALPVFRSSKIAMRTLAAVLIASSIVAYVVVAETLAAPIGIGGNHAMGFFALGTTISGLWYVAYKGIV